MKFCHYKMAGAEVDIIDLVEIYAGKATVTSLAPHFGLSSLQPFDIEYGIDLKDPENEKCLKNAISRFKPLLSLVAWPCRERSLFKQNMNYAHRLDELLERRLDEKPLVDLGCDICETQMEEGRFFLGENPTRSAIWNEERMEKLKEHPDVIVLRVRCRRIRRRN